MVTDAQKLKFLLESACKRGSGITRKMISEQAGIHYNTMISITNGFNPCTLDDINLIDRAINQLKKKAGSK